MPRRSAAHDAVKESGATMKEIDGWHIAIDFGAPDAEYRALRDGAALLDLSFRAKFAVGGRDAVRFLQNMLTNDIAALQTGHGCHAAKLDLAGKMMATMHVLRLENELWLDLEPGPAPAFETDLRKRIVLETAELNDMTNEWSLFGVQGPRAGECLGEAGIDVSGLDAELQHMTRSLGSHWMHIVRSDHCGAGGYDVWAPASEAALVWRLLGKWVHPAGLSALDVRRVEAGIPWHGRELTPDRFPQEAGLDEGWISYTKGCYLGQETISRLHHMGHVNRLLRGLHLDAPDVPGPGTQLFVGDKLVGWITSAARSPVLERVVALAFVRRESASPGTRVRVGSENGHAAEVTSLPMA